MKIIFEFVILVMIGSMIGWITNYIAIKLIFRPYEPKNILGFKLQGLIPKRRIEITENIAETVDKELISIKDITNAINSIELENEIDKIVNKIVDDKLKKEIIARFPIATMFLSQDLIDKIKSYVKDVIEENKQEMVEIIVNKIESEIDIKNMIVKKVENFSLEKQEKIVNEIAKKELKHIEIIGAILGALIGVLQFLITKIF